MKDTEKNKKKLQSRKPKGKDTEKIYAKKKNGMDVKGKDGGELRGEREEEDRRNR